MKRIIIVFSSVVLITALVLAIGLGSLKIYVDSNVDYAFDDKLFEAARRSNTVTYVAYDENGEELTVWRGSSGGRRTWIDLAEIPEVLQRGFIAMEDRTFYTHNGINLKRTLSAVLNYFVRSKPNFGASTITQQVVKNISGDSDYSVKRKITEIFRAIHLEMTHDKSEILEMYLNIVPMTGNIYGVREASLTFFAKEPFELSIAEVATIIGITNSPVRYDPYKNKEACTEKRDVVLGAMRECGVINDKEYKEALATALVTASETGVHSTIASWFVETANEDIVSDIMRKHDVSEKAAEMLLKSGTRVHLTMDTRVQSALETFFEDPNNLPGVVENGLQYAMAVYDSQSGNLAGIIGRAGKKEGNKLLNLANVPHPPASALKPIALYAPLVNSGRITWSTVFEDMPLSVKGEGEDMVYYPKNSPDVYEGRMTVNEALSKSKNTVALRLYDMLGGEWIFDHLENRYGFSTLVSEERGSNGSTLTDVAPAPLAMGQLTRGVTLRALTRAYTAFPSGGVIGSGSSYYRVYDADGRVLIESDKKSLKVMDAATANVMTQMLAGVVDGGTGRSIRLKELVDTAGKTGTSSGSRDKLFVGFTPYYTAGIWCGYDDGRAIEGVSPSHLKIWDAVMTEIHDRTVFEEDGELITFLKNGIVSVDYCAESGMLASESCRHLGCASIGYFKIGTTPVEKCDIHDVFE